MKETKASTRDNTVLVVRNAATDEDSQKAREVRESLSPKELRYLVSVTDDALAHCDHLLRHSTTILRSLTQGELAVLLYINEHREDATAVSIANAVGLTRPRITQIVNALEEKGYARRKPDPHDGRKMHVVISAAGERAVNNHRERAAGFLEYFLTQLGKEDSLLFLHLLKRSEEIFEGLDFAQISGIFREL